MKSITKKFINYINNPKIFFTILLEVISPILDDKSYLKLRWKLKMNYTLNLKEPITYNEKLQWLKLYYRNPLYHLLVDKYLVKEYVKNLIGERYVIPLINSWNSVDEIDWDSLPNQFVIKCSHDCGGVIICKDKSIFNIKEANKHLKKCQNTNYYYKSREWPYKDCQHKIFCEKYMEDQHGELRDYKWFCFNGEPKIMFIASNRQSKDETKFDFYDMDFNHLPFTNGHPNSELILKKPDSFEEMKKLARKMSQGIPHVRIDFYDINGSIYFGEYTFFHWGGMMPFKPIQWDYILGRYLDLPTINNNIK